MHINLKSPEFGECIEKIVKLFSYDTYTLLDCVLTEEGTDPEYSANIVYERIRMYLIF